MRRLAAATTFDENYVTRSPVFVIERQGRLVAFYGFRLIDGRMFLDDMFVAPELIGTGLGIRLWKHAVATAQAHEYSHFFIEADPNAEAFYVKLGAKRIGEIVSPSSGRRLPLLRFNVGPAEPMRRAVGTPEM